MYLTEFPSCLPCSQFSYREEKRQEAKAALAVVMVCSEAEAEAENGTRSANQNYQVNSYTNIDQPFLHLAHNKPFNPSIPSSVAQPSSDLAPFAQLTAHVSLSANQILV